MKTLRRSAVLVLPPVCTWRVSVAAIGGKAPPKAGPPGGGGSLVAGVEPAKNAGSVSGAGTAQVAVFPITEAGLPTPFCAGLAGVLLGGVRRTSRRP
jgi:hypothetical protein